MHRVVPWVRKVRCRCFRGAAAPGKGGTQCPSPLPSLGGTVLPVAIPGVLEGVPYLDSERVNSGVSFDGAHEEENDRGSLEGGNVAGNRGKANVADSRVEIDLLEVEVEPGGGHVPEMGSGFVPSGLVVAAVHVVAVRI